MVRAGCPQTFTCLTHMIYGAANMVLSVMGLGRADTRDGGL